MQAAQYLASRTRDAIALSHEIQQAPRLDSAVDLGYCVLIGNTVYQDGQEFAFDGPAEARAFILRRFW